MQVKTKYKQTECGLIPEDWNLSTVDSLGADPKPAIKAGPFGSNLTKDLYVSSGYKVYGQEQVIRGDLQFGDYFVTSKKYKELQSCAVEPGDVLLSLVGTTGKVLVIPDDAVQGIINPRLVRFSFDKSKVCSYFFKEMFESKPIQNRLTRSMQGGTMGVLSVGLLRPILIAIPPLPEQRAIAAALSDVDALINSLDRLIEKQRDIKQAAMQQLLTGKTRLPGFTVAWKSLRLGELTECCSGGTPSTLVPSYWNGQIPWMSSGELNLKKVFDVEGRITELGLRNSSTKIIPPKCVLVGLAGQGKTRGTVAMNLIELCTNQSIAAIFPNSAFVPEYVYYNLDSRYDELRRLSTGDGGRGGLNLSIIRALSLCLPPLEEQAAIAKALSDIDLELEILELRRDKTLLLKQGMMQELLTGRTRLV